MTKYKITGQCVRCEEHFNEVVESEKDKKQVWKEGHLCPHCKEQIVHSIYVSIIK